RPPSSPRNGLPVIGSIMRSPIARVTRTARSSRGFATSCSTERSTPRAPVAGVRNIVLKGAFYYRAAVRQPGVLEKYGKGTPNDWIERALLSRLNWLCILLMLVVDLYLFGFFIGPIVWGVQMIWIPFWAAGIINGVGHALGYR